MHKKFLAICTLACLFVFGCGGKKNRKVPDAGASQEPDKVLFERATTDIEHHKYEVARLTLQTLINTYPDSEYLAKAKLAIADSYYREGGMSNLTLSVKEYQDFITFFPFLDEAAYAQMQMGMAHYKRLEKPDRDRGEALAAEDALQTFLQKYPNSPLIPQAEQKLRDVQELLAEGDFRIAHYYYVKGSLKASGGRLLDLTSRYPLYSQADKANWMLAQVFERAEKGDIAARFYARIVRDYPLSDLVPQAKERLGKLGVPVPQADPQALARMQQDRDADRPKTSLIKRPLALVHSGPNLSSAARSGPPNLTPQSQEVLSIPEGPATAGAGMNVSGTTAGGQNSAVVSVVTPGSTGATLTPPTTGDPGAGASAGSTSTPVNPSQPTAGGATPDPAAKSAQNPCKIDDKSKPADKNKKQDDKNKKDCKESSSKKKSGVKKLIPW